MMVTNQVLVATDFHSIFPSYYESQWLPATVFPFHQKKEIHTVLEQDEDE